MTMKMPEGFAVQQSFENIPPVEGLSYALIAKGPEESTSGNAYLVGMAEDGDVQVLAFIDGAEGAAYRCESIAAEGDAPAASGAEPLVKTVGSFDGETGQIVIKQPEGHWRRYSRWDRMRKAPPTQPNAVVRTLPQCGCGGYLGAPMMFDSFEEMLSYFFVVFSDAESVNAKHAAILGADACAI